MSLLACFSQQDIIAVCPAGGKGQAPRVSCIPLFVGGMRLNLCLATCLDWVLTYSFKVSTRMVQVFIHAFFK